MQATPPDQGGGANAVTSSTVTLADAAAAGVARVDDNAIALFAFDEGVGDTATDSSGVGTPIVLQLSGTEWADGGGLRNVSGKAQASLDHSRKLFDRINASRAFTIEAWVIPDNNTQDGPARIVSYSLDTGQRNFTMGQNAIYYQLRNRSAGTDNNGTPALEALDPQVDTTLTHVAMTFDEATGRKVYINGQLAIEENTADTLDWTDDQLLVLGNEVTDDRLWQGVFRMVAIHDQALSGVQVQQNYDAGAGEVLTLRFDISEAVGETAYVDMQVEQIDDKAYMFAVPTYVGDATDVAFKNIRVAVNDTVPVAAQVFRRVDTVAAASGTQLSLQGAVIPVGVSPEMDTFHLQFGELAGLVGTTEAIAPPLPPPPLPDVEEPDLGVRSFSQVNDSMASLTGVDANDADVAALYAELRGTLPSTTNLLAFSSAQQIAIQRLAVGYCAEVVNNAAACDAFFGDCQIDANGKDAVADVLYDRFIGDNLANQPARAGVSAEIVSMIDDLGCANGCTGATAETALNATCAAVLSSNAVTIN